MRYARSAFNNQFLDSFFHQGGNNNEHLHENDNRWFKYLKQDGVGWKASIATTYNQQFKHNAHRVGLLKDVTETLPSNDRPWTNEFVNELNAKFDEGDSLTQLKKNVLQENDHGFLKFNDIDPELKDHLNGLCIFG